ncbi:YHS domain-containing protein [Halalkalicoccus jeotgali]|uniref:YHS domain-containing protein n=1 Tax=Halalkalicoccus jeotgali (strain DSM 18796 / CECT 7217 / JCM 14584 / KCTC 4019 / B3) TaxID=795797 RepID=D8J5F9_HALJB|nr:YHS domain-containing protein [Halalkalicoccus jeotgali]ADJ15655.1 hypothetical protein HacjB3_11360 [Halalkalicoccus jeotgali B3]ELY36575.1 hypothetical protein C497_11288 [Halalkalicoccus jeotgali B3]
MTDCPVCNNEIEGETPGSEAGYGGENYAPAQTEYEGEVYYFCCSDHKESFESAPEEYAGS